MDLPSEDQAGEVTTPNADHILAKMRADNDSDWPDRLMHNMARGHTSQLSTGETRALQAASHGLTDQMTADTYGLTLDTIKTQLKHARAKLNAKNTAHAIAIGIRQGLF